MSMALTAWVLSVISGLAVAAIIAGFKLVPRVLGDLREIRTTAAAIQVTNTQRFTDIDAALGTINREIHTNGGSSLKDAVLRVEAAQSSNGSTLAEHLTDSAYKQGVIDAYIQSHP